MIMVVECKCTGGQPHMARQNMGSQNRLDQIMGCHTCRLCQDMGSQNFNNSLGTKWVSQDMIMAMEYQCVRGCYLSLRITWVAKIGLTNSWAVMHLGCVKSWVAKGLAVSSHDLARGLDKHGSDMNA